MMESYAIVLYFDEKANNSIQKEIDNMSLLTVNTYMIDAKIPPHITVGCFWGDSPDPMVEMIEKLRKKVEPFEVTFSGVGTFPPKVIFAAPIKDDRLERINRLVHEMFIGNFQAADQENYIPTKWIPHCALAVRLDEEQFNRVSMAKLELPAAARVQRIALARCNPYQEIKVFQL